MIETLQRLIAVLREELQQYGEMLDLLERQQEAVVSRASTEVYESVGAVQTQATRIQKARATRQDCQQRLAEALHLPARAAFLEIFPRLPDEYRPLVHALVQENNELLVRVQQRARQNHLLLRRSLELMQNLIASFLQIHETSVYNDHGSRVSHILPAQPLYEAVG